MGESAYYAVDVEEAAAVLRETPDRVREMLVTGELEGIPPGGTAQGDWKVLLPASPDLAQPALADEPPESSREDQAEDPATDEGPGKPAGPPEGAADAEERSPAAEESPRGDVAAADREPAAPSGWVSTQQAARALGISPRTVRWHIEQSNLEAKPEGEGVRRSWLVSIDSLQAFRDARQAAGEVPRDRRAPAEGSEIAAASPGNAVRELADRLAEEAARAAEYRVRLEITEQAASTVQAELEEERRRRETAERERDELRRRLEARSEPLGAASEATEQPGRVEPQPAIEGTQEPRESSEMHMPEAGGGPPPRDQQRTSERPWWRRLFGG
jgi:hypothetical protein